MDDAIIVSMVVHAAQYKPDVPSTRQEAINSDDAHLWHKAEKSEYDLLIENKTWVLVPHPNNKPVISCRWVYDKKDDGQHKACLVAHGFTQIGSENYHETFSSVAQFESIQYLTVHAALED